ncbi:MAG: methyl-accepting chemotaxis protein [Phyllobacterium sp.]
MSTVEPKTKELNERLNFIGLNAEQRNALATAAPVITESLSPALDRFYELSTTNPHTARFFSSKEHVKSAKSRQQTHWTRIAAGKFDAQYIDAVTSIGKTHARIGLEPSWYIGGYGLILETIISSLIADHLSGFIHGKKAARLSTTLAAVIKAALVDMDYAISVYLEALNNERVKSEHERERMSAQQKDALTALDTCLNRLANGDLTATIDQELAPEFASLKTNYNNAVGGLATTFGKIAAAAADTSSNAQELTVATDDMARRTEQQAAALEQTAAALEQITAISDQSALRTKETQQSVAAATEEALRSHEVVAQAVEAMSAIEDSSQKITQIIGVIDDISFQTNLLALNAGVEAARAGDAGKGFAVVAQEVRALAQRSAVAAKEIKTLIGKSSDDVALGVSLVNRTGETLTTIGNHVQKINGDIGSIATSAHEQLTGIRGINIAVTSLDRVTQQNAAMVEQTNAATHSLMGISRTLTDLINHFNVAARYQEQGSRR